MCEASRAFLRPMLGFSKEMTLKAHVTKRNLSRQDLEHCKGPKGDKALCVCRAVGLLMHLKPVRKEHTDIVSKVGTRM